MPNPKPYTVCLTGGGTAGHVMPHFALLPEMQRRGWQVMYIGSNGIEKDLVQAKGIPFYQIMAGKLRRYFSLKNFLDIFKVGLGCVQAMGLLLMRRPDVVFSKGGFVAVPVAVAAWVLRIPVVSHESDVTPGLANKLIAPLAQKLLVTFPETQKHLPQAQHVGTPIRQELLRGDPTEGLQMSGLPDNELPVLMIMGGSQGAQMVNDAVAEAFPELVQRFRLIHLCGKGKRLDLKHENYSSFEYVSERLEHLLAFADVVVSRAGANSIFELLALSKPMLLIPLAAGSRGDQIVNAQSFAQQGFALTLDEGSLTSAKLLAGLATLLESRQEMLQSQRSFAAQNSHHEICDIIGTWQ